jgi:YVTN family beta-propeller protein
VDVTVTTPAGTSTASPADLYTSVPTAKHAVLYVANNGDSTLKIYDPAAGTITASIAAGPDAFEVALNPAATQAWVSDAGGNTVTIIDTTTHVVTGTITTGPSPAAPPPTCQTPATAPSPARAPSP